MPTLAQHHSNKLLKLLLLGDSKSGKTTSLASLVAEGYKLRILDLDNLLDFFAQKVRETCPQNLGNVEVRTLRDKRKATALGHIIDGQPKAFVETIKMLDRWKYKDGETEIDLGPPATWGPDCILVIDSLSRLCDAAFDFREPLTPTGKNTGEKDMRAVYGDAQDAVESTLAHLTSSAFATNVIVICHGMYMDLPDGTKKIFPQGVGQKLSPKIPQYFPSYVRYKNVEGQRTIQLESDPMIDLANPNPTKLGKTLPVETGLATIFNTMLKGDEAPKQTKVTQIQPKTVNRR